MDFDLKDVLGAIGPSAALVFASWIFLGFLEQRYVAAYERFRKLVEQYRANQSSKTRHQNLRDQIRTPTPWHHRGHPAADNADMRRIGSHI
jgi:hypothetical protein